MGFLKRLKGWFSNMLWHRTAEELFDVKIKDRDESLAFIRRCVDAYKGKPYWTNEYDDEIVTTNVAKTICSEVARLATMNIEINITGSARADWLQEQMDEAKPDIRRWVEYGCAAGEIMLKPNGDDIDIWLPDDYIVTEENGSHITGIIFINSYYDSKQDAYESRLEYHRIDEDGKYRISNRCFLGDSPQDFKQRVDIEQTVWADLEEDTTVDNTDHLLFGVLRMPSANNIDLSSRRGLPIFADAMRELEDLDVAYSRNATEIFDSKRTIIIDSDRLIASGGKIGASNKEVLIEQAGLPKYVKALEGTGQGDIYHEINPTLNTPTRLTGIDALLSQIGFKCGFSNGYFVFNEKTGTVTATQVESEDRRTIQTVNDVRKQLESCLDGLIEALNVFADAYDLAPRGEYEVQYDFADLTLNEDEDKARWFTYVSQGLVPFWYFLMKYEGFTEEDAKALEQEQRQAQLQAQQDMLMAGAVFGTQQTDSAV